MTTKLNRSMKIQMSGTLQSFIAGSLLTVRYGMKYIIINKAAKIINFRLVGFKRPLAVIVLHEDYIYSLRMIISYILAFVSFLN